MKKIPKHRQIFCNRTLNMRQVKAIGYDMDYTLIHYRVDEWEKRAYNYAKQKFLNQGWQIEHLVFIPDLMMRGLILDTLLGNILKVNSFGYVKKAFHGTMPIDFEIQKHTYAQTVVSLSDARYIFLNTLFSLSEGCLYSQLVDMLDAKALPAALGYADLYRLVRDNIDAAHLEGQLKDEIMANPAKFVELDCDIPLALLDQKHAGKKLLLITNSDWRYTQAMMAFVFDRYLPQGMSWRQLFDIILVSARKPDFFTQPGLLFQVVEKDDYLLKPASAILSENGVYWGGDAATIEAALMLSGDEILYVGDHIYGDVNVSKKTLRWRTALILRELENDLQSLTLFTKKQQALQKLMHKKSGIESYMAHLRLQLQRHKQKYGPKPAVAEHVLRDKLTKLHEQLLALDLQIKPLATSAAVLGNQYWGSLLRAGNEKSHLARQIERYADIYMSRVSNFLFQTPFMYMRAQRALLPHDT